MLTSHETYNIYNRIVEDEDRCPGQESLQNEEDRKAQSALPPEARLQKPSFFLPPQRQDQVRHHRSRDGAHPLELQSLPEIEIVPAGSGVAVRHFGIREVFGGGQEQQSVFVLSVDGGEGVEEEDGDREAHTGEEISAEAGGSA